MDRTRPRNPSVRPLGRAATSILVAVASLVGVAGCTTTADPGAGPTTTSTVAGTEPAPGTTVTPPTPTSDALVPAACDGGLDVRSSGTIDAAAGAELSGIVASRARPGVWWVHNDSGAGPMIHAVSEGGQLLATYDLGTDAVDWEDIAIAPDGDHRWSLLIGDIGDNAESRPSVQVLRITEPDVDPSRADPEARPVGDVATVALTYPDRPRNAEALLVDPDTGQLVIITKEVTGPAQVLTADAADLTDGATVVLTPAGTVDLGGEALTSWVTAADISPDGTLVAVRTYGGVHLFAREPGRSVADALAGTSCAAPPPLEAQGEAIAIAADGRSYLTVAEGETPILHRTAPVAG